LIPEPLEKALSPSARIANSSPRPVRLLLSVFEQPREAIQWKLLGPSDKAAAGLSHLHKDSVDPAGDTCAPMYSMN
jgi:hypothetical protein